MEIIITVVIATIGGLWGVFKYIQNQYQTLYDGLEARVIKVEQTVSEHGVKIDHLEEEIKDIKATLSNIQKDVHNIDKNVSRLVVLVEKNKGA